MTTTETTTNILTVRTSENAALSTALLGLRERMEHAARENINAQLAPMGQSLDDFTGTEQLALIRVEEFRLVNDMDLATIVLRGQILTEIEDQGLHTVHPNHFATVEDMAEELGISPSEVSDIRNMTRIIFPFIEQRMGVPVAQIWDRIGKAKFRVMVPTLKALITGEMPGRGQTLDSVNRLIEEAEATFGDMGQTNVEPEEVRHQAAENLISVAQTAPVREVVNHIRQGNVTPALNPVVVEVDGRKFMFSEVDDDQMLVVTRKLGRHMSEPVRYHLPADPRARQREAAQIGLLRNIVNLLEG